MSDGCEEGAEPAGKDTSFMDHSEGEDSYTGET